MTLPSGCIISDDARRTVSFEENNRKYQAQNPNGRRLTAYRIDDCVIKNAETCDFALDFPEFNHICLIELKGKDLKKAAQQIQATLDRLSANLSSRVVHARIVLSRVQRPDLQSSQFVQLARSLAKRGGSIGKACVSMSEDVDSLIGKAR